MSFITDFFQFEFLLLAMLSTIILSIICGMLSPFIISKGHAFMGASVSHSTIVGLAISLSVFASENYYKVYLLTLFITLFLAVGLAFASFKERLPFDSLVGVFFSVTMAIGILIFYLFGKNQNIDLLGYLFGDILMLQKIDVFIALVNLFIIFIIFFNRFKKWQYFIFDEQGAEVSGQKTFYYHLTLICLLTLVIVSSLKIAGVVLINTMLLIPGIFALKLSKNLKETFIYSILFSLTSSSIGLILSNSLNTPSGATICCFQFILLILASLYKKMTQPH